MLLEGLDVEPDSDLRKMTMVSGDTRGHAKKLANSSGNIKNKQANDNCDRLLLNEVNRKVVASSAGSSYDKSEASIEDSTSSKGEEESLQGLMEQTKHHNSHYNNNNNNDHNLETVPKMQSKGTSTTSDSISSRSLRGAAMHPTGGKFSDDNDLDGNDDAQAKYEAIPSRTIAIQCDLKSSSVKRADGYFESTNDLANMQASSISATRYGFYRISPDTMEQRRKFARSISSRNIAHNQQQESAMSVSDEATPPASIKSDQSSVSGHEEALLSRRRKSSAKLDRIGPPLDDLMVADHRNMRKNDNNLRHDYNLHRRKFSSNQNVMDSLPRRPKTALSYVSTSRLRDDSLADEKRSHLGCTSPDSQRFDGGDDGTARGLTRRERAKSHQVLSRPVGSSVLHPSDDEARQQQFNCSRSVSATSTASDLDAHELLADKYRVPHNEEIVLSRRNKPLIEAQHQQSQFHHKRQNRSNNHADRQFDSISPVRATSGPPPRRSPNVDYDLERDLDSDIERRSASQLRQTGQSRVLHAHHSGNRFDQDDDDDDANHDGDAVGRPTKLKRSATMNRLHSMAALDREIDFVNSGQPNHHRHHLSSSSRARKNPLGDGTIESTARDRIPNEQQQPQAVRYNSMSLSRRPSSDQRSCNSIARRPSGLTNGNGNNKHQLDVKTTGAFIDSRKAHTSPLRVRASNPLESQQPALIKRHHQAKNVNNKLNYYHDGDDDDDENAEVALDAEQESLVHRSRKTSTNSAANGHHTHNLKHNLNPNQANVLRSTSMSQMPVSGAVEANGRLFAQMNNGNSNQRAVTRSKDFASSNKIPQHFVVDDDDELYDEDEDVDEMHMYRGQPGYQSMAKQNGEYFERQPRQQRHIQQPSTTSMTKNGFRYQSDESGASEEAGSSLENSQFLAARVHHPLDYDSQNRLNESGLPEPNFPIDNPQHYHRNNHQLAAGNRDAAQAPPPEAPVSHLGLVTPSAPMSQTPTIARSKRFATTGRSGAHSVITGRAMSSQSLARPSMTSGRRSRRPGAAGDASNSGSDVGGSSMSLTSQQGRLYGGSRYENAHTRTPVVMYIPQATASAAASKQGSMSDLTNRRGRASSRRSSRTRMGSSSNNKSSASSQDRRKGSLSRDASDSEAGQTSMLRTLVKRRTSNAGRVNGNSSGRSRHAESNLNDDEEDVDGVGKLATEIDSYRFRRRYSVPKDAKINWFAKLRQRVISKS